MDDYSEQCKMEPSSEIDLQQYYREVARTTLRDKFATTAMAELLADVLKNTERKCLLNDLDDVAISAYAMAEAMLKARLK